MKVPLFAAIACLVGCSGATYLQVDVIAPASDAGFGASAPVPDAAAPTPPAVDAAGSPLDAAPAPLDAGTPADAADAADTAPHVDAGSCWREPTDDHACYPTAPFAYKCSDYSWDAGLYVGAPCPASGGPLPWVICCAASDAGDGGGQ